jgi:hypothetical protein
MTTTVETSRVKKKKKKVLESDAKIGHIWHLQVLSQVLRSPILKQKARDDKQWNGQQVVVKHSIKVLKVEHLDALAHEQDEGSRGKAVGSHPNIANDGCIQLDQFRKCGRNIRPTSDDGRKYLCVTSVQGKVEYLDSATNSVR